jgi:uncharacterized protein YgiM (DUF1202 family)
VKKRALYYLVAVNTALLVAVIACSISPSWVPSPTPGPTGTADPTPERAPQAPRLKGTAAPAPGPIRETVSAIEALNVRQEASEKSPSLGTLLHGAEVELTGICSDPPGWAEVRYKSGRAWVKARYITGDLCEAE